jgi:hypothetical protein
MHLDLIRRTLISDISKPGTLAAFNQGRDSNEVLASFEGPADVIDYLNSQDLGTARQRSAVTAALITEARRSSSSCWASILLLAYFPGLLRIRASLRPAAYLDHEGLGALVLEAFMEVVGTLPLETQGRRAVVNLFLTTRKLVWQHLVRDEERANLERPLRDREEELIGGTYPSPEQALLALEAEDLLRPERFAEWLRELSGEEDGDALLLVLGTYASGKPLIEWVREQNPGIGGTELVLEYGRLRQRRARMLERLRRRLASWPMAPERTRVGVLLHVLDASRAGVLL